MNDNQRATGDSLRRLLRFPWWGFFPFGATAVSSGNQETFP
ncbi:MAG: hypothetical protein ACRENC_17955 [Gemmatimonadaceae bacterium]